MRVYFSSPASQLQAHAVNGLDVLMSYGRARDKWLLQYVCSFRRLLIDSGAFSVLNSGAKLDIEGYKDWATQFQGRAEAIAGLDDISGDWRQSLSNYEAFPSSFPTFHDSDPPELLDDLIPMARERGRWLGIGLVPPRQGKEEFVRRTLERIPDDIHVHGWALGGHYPHLQRIDSTDSTAAWRIAMRYRQMPELAHLTYAECLDIVVKRIVRTSEKAGSSSHPS